MSDDLVKLYRDGSSPRVRGTEATLIDHMGSDRFIPARAGNSYK